MTHYRNEMCKEQQPGLERRSLFSVHSLRRHSGALARALRGALIAATVLVCGLAGLVAWTWANLQAAVACPCRGVVRHRARPQRPAAARLHLARRPLASSGGGQGCRSALSRDADRVRGQALPTPSWRRSAGGGPGRMAAGSAPPPTVRRLDAHHAGGAAAAGRARAIAARQDPASPAGTPARLAFVEGRDPRAFTCGWRHSAATSKACAPRRSPISARSRGGCRWEKRPYWSPFRSRPDTPPGSLSRRPPSAHATTCWRACSRPA